MKKKNNNIEDTKKFKFKGGFEPSSKKVNIRKKHKRYKVIMSLIFFIVIMLGINFGLSYMKWKKLAFLVFNNEPSIVYNQEGEEIAKIGEARKQENVSFSDIPENLKNAYISIEDQRYYTHHGIDVKRTASAILNYITKQRSSFGGSTITQQLVKNITGNDSNTISRKVSEWVLSLELETMLSKEEILEEYFNIIYLAPNIYGVKSGAIYYFNKDLSELTLEECAFLAGLNHTPNTYNPFNNSDNSEIIKTRTKTVLGKMLELGYITEDEYTVAKNNTDKGLNFKKGTVTASGNGVYSYHTDALITELINDLEEKYNISEDFAENIVYLGNLKIYSTEKKDIQSTLETEFKKSKYILPSSNKEGETSQAAMVIIDQKTGYVVGLVGGLGEKTTSRGFNRATQALRQTGSAGKPLAVVAPALSEGVITAASIYADEPTTFEDNTEEGYSPIDYNSYRGNISVRQALESSQNIPFVKIIEQITPAKSIEYLKKFGITTLQDTDNNLSLALGGLSKGISPLEMAAAYATIANNGKYIEPTFYIKATNNSETLLIKSSQETRRVLTKENAYILQDLLTEPVKGTYGTAPYCNINGMSVAAKTGTTNDNYDKWLCGFTPYYTAATWYGYDYNETINYNNKNPAGILWANTMIKIHNGLDSKEFTKPSSIEQLNICIETGLLATTGCKHTYTEYFTKDNLPEKCNIHDGELLDEVESTTRNTTQSYTISQNTVVDVIDDIKSTWEDITESYSSPTNESTTNTTTTIQETQNKIEEKTYEILNEIQKEQNNTTTTNTIDNTITNTSTTNNITNSTIEEVLPENILQ